MRPQTFDIVDLEAGPLHPELDVADAVELAVREHVAIDELGRDGPVPALLVMGDAVVEEQPARTQHTLDCRIVGRQIREADMLEHADAGHLVVDRHAVEIAVVAQLDGDEILQALVADALACIFELPLAERDAVRANAVMARRPADQRAPAAADVEQAVSGLQAQLAADVLQLVALGLLERVVGGLEVGAGVDPLGIQPQAVEGVGHIVVERDRRLVGLT